MSEKVAIKKSTLEAIGEAVRGKDGSTDLIPVNALADRITAIPTPSGENKFIPFLQSDPTLELTKQDLQDLQDPLPSGIFSNKKMKSIELPEHITTLPSDCFASSTIETIKTYARKFYTRSFGFFSTDTTTVNLYLLANDFIASSAPWFYNDTSKQFNLHFNNEDAYNNYLYAATQYSGGSTFQNIGISSIYYGETLATEINIHSKITAFGNTPLFLKVVGVKKIKFFGDITSIPDYCFYNCSSLQEIDFTACTRVPTLKSMWVLQGLATNYKIKVPATLYNDWIAATNWSSSNIASHIVAV